ncbi:head-tail adaptor protein [Paenibacillus validus]|uniref:phage head completion protein n=1 Tax=Paenibacillus validus TaxID=44253 RepID=UPI0013DE9A3A|nr:head-tail adaptor protein [Paenibacillus validus]MED4599874.1 head-tail adaptor protein [Paenibacillus validus]MED4606093.1 head-tail adaptor protein [Paenibacillus validus]
MQLFKLTYASTPSGDSITPAPTKSIFAEKKSIRMSEFYQAFASRLSPEVMFIIWDDEYNGEERLVWNGTVYKIDRTFATKNRRLEVVCTQLDDIKTNLSRLRDTVQIWHNTFVLNSMNERSPSTSLLYTVQAEIDYKGGGTGLGEGETVETTTNAVVTIIYRDGITPDMFLMIDGNRWDIEFISNPYNHNETLQLTVRQVTP